jgi:GNAT superfamily N-acetyltransferase
VPADAETYLASLVGSWRALAAAHHEARVVVGPGFVAMVDPGVPVLDNALLLDAEALDAAVACYPEDTTYAVWTWDAAAAAAMVSAGFRHDDVTHPMVLDLVDPAALPVLAVLAGPSDPADAGMAVEADVGAAPIAGLNGLGADILDGVPGLRTYATRDRTAGAALIEVGSDVNVSFVATRPEARRRGLAHRVLQHALADARRDGFTTSSLQATSMARGVYARLGYREVGRWDEWVPRASAPS